MRDPAFGRLFENLGVIEALKTRCNQGKRPDLYFFRDNNRNEVDLIFSGDMQPEMESASVLNFKRTAEIFQ